MGGLCKGCDTRVSVMRAKFDCPGIRRAVQIRDVIQGPVSREQCPLFLASGGGSSKGCDARDSVMRAMSTVPGIRWWFK